MNFKEDPLFWTLLEEYIYGVDLAKEALCDYLEDKGYSKIAKEARSDLVLYKPLEELYLEKTLPKFKNLEDKEFVDAYSNTKDKDFRNLLRKYATGYQKDLAHYCDIFNLTKLSPGEGEHFIDPIRYLYRSIDSLSRMFFNLKDENL